MAGHVVTLELPDALFQKFKLRSQRTKRSIEDELLNAFALDMPLLPLSETRELKAYNEVLEFLSSGPSSAEIATFQLSDEATQRAQSLLAKERTAGLTDAEVAELDYYVELGDFLELLRTKAELQLLGDPRP